MKKALLVLLTTIGNLAAMGQCAPQPPGNAGFFPAAEDIPCIERGVPYSATINFQSFDSIFFQGMTFTADEMVIDSIVNLPCGIGWSTNKPGNLWQTSENGCITLQGSTLNDVGQYKIDIYAQITLPALGTVSFTFESAGLRLDLRVKANAAAICPPIDTVSIVALDTASCTTGFQSNLFNEVRGKVYVDVDANGSFSAGDYGIANQRINVGGVTSAYTNSNGDYLLYFPIGNYSVSVDANPNYTVTSVPVQYNFNFLGTGDDTLGNDFGLAVTNEIHDLSVVVNNSFFRPGFAGNYQVLVTNLGTVKDSGTVHLNFDTLFNVTGTNPVADNLTDSTATWTVNAILPGQTQSFTLDLTTPVDVTLLGTLVTATGYLNALGGDNDLANDTFVNIAEIRGAYDPNDKTPYPGTLSESFVDAEGYIVYRIRFQNTGNDTAFNIVVRDTINSPHLDLSTFQLLSASHEYTFQMDDNNIGIWTFNNILLPDSNINEPGSHGYIFFRIKIDNANLEDGSEILNQAGIYFDFNPVVMTDASVALVDFGIGIREVVRANANIRVYPNPSSGSITIEHKQWTAGNELMLLDLAGKEMLRLPLTGTLTEAELGHLPNGIYIYHIAGPAGSEGTGKIVVGK